MKSADRTRLTQALRAHVAAIAEDLRAQMRAPGEVRDRALKLHADEQVGEDFDVWTDLLSRRAAVLWVLKSVYLRVFEDRGLLEPGRLLDPETQQLFERLAPNLGETAFLRWIYKDLAQAQGGLPELFAPQPAEICTPADGLSRALIQFWRNKDPDTGAYWSFTEERFEGELMGDLYQELDPVVKDRFALCQTPDFVRAFMLDRTLTPAIEEFGATQVRLLDPACGSGHFLIDGLKRLVSATSEAEPSWERRRVVEHCLDRVVGIDLNDYACALARARLLMTAAELAGIDTLAEAAELSPHVYWADGLEQVEEGLDTRGEQLGLFEKKAEPVSSLSRADVRSVLREVIGPKFHAVVANPPYIVEKDDARKAYHREKIGKRRRYVSAYRQYSLASPFTERCFQVAVDSGFVGLITSNNFQKREFGKALIEDFLSQVDLTLVCDTSQAYIPFHGTPTVLLFGRNQKQSAETIRAVMGRRGETGTPDDPAKGRVWSSIAEGWDKVGFENEFVTVADVARETFDKHPWSLGGGGASELKVRLEQTSPTRIGELSDEIGVVVVLREDELFMQGRGLKTRGVPPVAARRALDGAGLRDWQVQLGTSTLWPYDSASLQPIEAEPRARVETAMWPWRSILSKRTAFGKTQLERGLPWFGYSMLFESREKAGMLLAFPKVATHNHFALYRGGAVAIASTHIIKLPEGATEDDHLALLGLLNSSTACFWMKQVFHVKGGESTGKKRQSENWSRRLEFDGTKLQATPIVTERRQAIQSLAHAIDASAQQALACSAQAVLQSSWQPGSLTAKLAEASVRLQALRRSMIAYQEELDWTAYAAYGLLDDLEEVPLDAIEPMQSQHRPFAIHHARRAARGEATLYWFEAMEVAPCEDIPTDYRPDTQERIAARIKLLETVHEIGLIETPNYKRKWEPIHFDDDLKQALRAWLADRVESVVQAWKKPATLGHMVSALQDDLAFLEVAETYTERKDVDLSVLVGQLVTADAVPNHPTHVYTEAGLVNRAAWEKTWALQRREDAGEDVGPIEVPPEYAQGSRGKPTHFLRTEYWRLRGKLDVPKERFIAFTEVPGHTDAETLYGWAGWTPIQRIRALLALDEDLEDAGLDLTDRAGLLDSAWRLLPDAAREDEPTATRLQAELQSLLGQQGPTPELLQAWSEKHPPPTKSKRGKRKKKT